MRELWKKFWQCHKNFQDEKLKVKGKPIADNNRSFKNRIVRQAKSLSRKHDKNVEIHSILANSNIFILY